MLWFTRLNSLYLLPETCRCSKTLRATWDEVQPYVNSSDGGKTPEGIIPPFFEDMVVYCCGACAVSGRTEVQFHSLQSDASSIGQGNMAYTTSYHLLQAQVSYKRKFGHADIRRYYI